MPLVQGKLIVRTERSEPYWPQKLAESVDGTDG